MYDYIVNICILGDSAVGKTSLTNFIVNNNFNYNIDTTIGVEFNTKIFDIVANNVNYKLKWLIWDTAGNINFRSIITSYLKNATIYFIMFDLSNLDSFNSIIDFFNLINEKGTNDNFIYLIGNKVDIEYSEVSNHKISLMANELDLKYFIISVKQNLSIKNMIDEINKDLMDYILNKSISKDEKIRNKIRFKDDKVINLNDNYKPKKNNCC